MKIVRLQRLRCGIASFFNPHKRLNFQAQSHQLRFFLVLTLQDRDPSEIPTIYHVKHLHGLVGIHLLRKAPRNFHGNDRNGFRSRDFPKEPPVKHRDPSLLLLHFFAHHLQSWKPGPVGAMAMGLWICHD